MAPNGWSKIKLGDLTKVITSGSRDWAKYYADSGSKFIRMTNLNRHGIHLLLDDLKYVSVDSISSDGKRTALQAGDILCSITAELGKIGWIPENFGEAYINQHTALIRIDAKKADSKFIAYQLSSNRINQVINSLNDAGAKAGLNLPTIKAIPIFYPPLIEQKKIAKILSTWDQAISATEKLLKNSQEQKKALMQQLLTGKKRLLDENGVKFSDEWQRIELGLLLDYQQPTPYLVESTAYSDSYETPVLTAGKTFILGYTNESSGIYQDQLPVIIFDDFTTDSKYVNFPFKAKSSAMKILTAKKGVSIKFVFEAMQMLQFTVGGHQRHWISIFSNLVIPLPNKKEQQQIAEVLSLADQEIETLQKKLDCLQQEKKALMQQLLTGKKRVKVAA
ncbi:restriction endonuclease subunit S [Acinetobacter baumannii]|nr:restriction endonuclease subunit S [Acinetobacter baumannii]EKU0759469.1 restriction endonuclease subunit S [Acinetobacter baumannii]EKV8394067.1 restriction endonuclease subunit S [Acinetobacter baumannii]EKW0730837.1 restriction endonuclease subunit S [Acinetobacter baumannii]EKW0739176.1 restriction endonuclease subunit S [Acinetobacter baumannii]